MTANGKGPDLALCWILFLGLVLAGGTPVVRALVWRPALRTSGVSDPIGEGEWKGAATAALAGAVVAIHAELFSFLASAHAVTGGTIRDFADAQIQRFRSGTRFGASWTWTTFVWLAVISLIVVAWMSRGSGVKDVSSRRDCLPWPPGSGSAARAMRGPILRCWPASTSFTLWPAIWTAGLRLLASLPLRTARLDQGVRRQVANATLYRYRFSALALWPVLAVVGAGAYLALGVGRWPASLGNAWGAGLAVKSAWPPWPWGWARTTAGG